MGREDLFEDLLLTRTQRIRISHLVEELKEHSKQRNQQEQIFPGWKEPGVLQEQKRGADVAGVL